MRRLIVLCALLLTLAVGCGDDDETVAGSGSSTTGPSASTGTTDSTGPPTTEVSSTSAPATSAPMADGAVRITGYETSFGMCAGWCRTTLQIDGPALALEASDRMQERVATSEGSLTDEGLQRLAAAAAAVETAELDEVYGCPDCADGGAASLTFTTGGGTVTSTFDFGGPPPELVVADALGAELLEALRTCTTTELVAVADDCEPLAP